MFTAAIQEAAFIHVNKKFDIESSTSIPIYGDNQGVIALVKNPVNHDRIERIDIK